MKPGLDGALPVPRLALGLWGEEQALGSLIVTGVLIEASNSRALDSMALPDPRELAAGRAGSWGRKVEMLAPAEVVKLSAAKYNSLWSRHRNRDPVLNFCYLTVIRALRSRFPEVEQVVYGVEAVGFAVLATEVDSGGRLAMVYRGVQAPDPGTWAATMLARAVYERELQEMQTALELEKSPAEFAEPELASRLLARGGRPTLLAAFKRDSRIVEQVLATPETPG